MHVAPCVHPGQCWSSGRGRQTMAWQDYSAALLFQHTAWTTLQFWRLHVTLTIVLLFVERALHSTLSHVAMAAIAHVFKEYCGSGGEESTDFVTMAAPYVFDFHLAMGVQLVGLAPSRFGAWGGWRGGSLGVGARMAMMVLVWTGGEGSGGGANNGQGNGAALSAAPLPTLAATSWRRGGQRCLGIVGRPTLTGAMSSRWRGVYSALPLLTVPCSLARRRVGRGGGQQCPDIVGRSLACLCDGDGGGQTTVAQFCAGGSGGQTKVPGHCCAMAVVVRPTIMPLDSRPSLACSWMVRMEAAAWTDGGGSGGGASNGGGNSSALSAVPSLARVSTSWRRGGQQCLDGHRRSVEGRGRHIERRFKVGWAANVCTGRVFSRRGFYPSLK